MGVPPSSPPPPAAVLPTQPWVVAGACACLLVLAPQVFGGSLSLHVMSQIGIAAIACLSYNLLLGQGGMLSFGHAVYTGLGAYAAIHALQAMNQGSLVLPVSLVPLVGGIAGLACAALLGPLGVRASGTTFAMVTLGLGELVFAGALMFPALFGGEAGLSANRVVGSPFLGIDFASGLQVYYLIALYVLLCGSLLYGFTATPLGRMLHAVRDNPERAAFVGYDPRRVRYLAFLVAGFFAGIAGGLGAIHTEAVTPEVLGAPRSGAYLLFTFLGGTGFFFGPVIGAVLMVFALVLLSAVTRAWLLYVGLVFLLFVMAAPGGVASIVAAYARVAVVGRWRVLLPLHTALAAAGLAALAGFSALVEMVYHLQLDDALGPHLSYLGLQLDTRNPAVWAAASLLLLGGGALAVQLWHRLQCCGPGARRGVAPAGRSRGGP